MGAADGSGGSTTNAAVDDVARGAGGFTGQARCTRDVLRIDHKVVGGPGGEPVDNGKLS